MRSMTALRVGHLGVDLAAGGVALVGLAYNGERLARPPDLGHHHQRRDQPAVGVEVAGEVVVRRVLATELGSGFGHDLLDERVPDLGPHRIAPELGHDFGNRLRTDQVVQDRRAGMLAQRRGREQRCRGRAAQSTPGLVDHEHTVGVTVEGEAQVEPAGDHPGAKITLVGGLQRVGRVVRERAVEFGVHDLELDAGQSLEHGRNHESAHAVGRVGDDPHRRRCRPDR